MQGQQTVCKPKKHVPMSGKMHHTNQSQNYMANHVSWLLRNRGKLWEGRQRKSDCSSGGCRDGEFSELRDL